MSNYVKATNFATKDTLPTGDSNKIVKGTEIDNEFNAIAGAVSSKADLASPAFTGTPTAPTAIATTNTTQVATTAFVQTVVNTAIDAVDSSATQTLTNKTIALGSNTVTGTLAEFNTAVTDANLASLAGSETLTNKTIALGSNTISGTKSQFNTAVTDTDFAFTNDFTGSNQSLSTNGYQKLPGGLIFQWCESGAGSGERDETVSFPSTFPTAVLQVVVGTDVEGNPGDLICQLVSKTTSNCVVRFNGLGSNDNAKAIIFAIGY